MRVITGARSLERWFEEQTRADIAVTGVGALSNTFMLRQLNLVDHVLVVGQDSVEMHSLELSPGAILSNDPREGFRSSEITARADLIADGGEGAMQLLVRAQARDKPDASSGPAADKKAGGSKLDPAAMATREMRVCFDLLSADLQGVGSVQGSTPFDAAFIETTACVALSPPRRGRRGITRCVAVSELSKPS